MFDELDKNFDGQLSWQEFIGEETTIERAFKLFDENNDGTISKAVSQKQLKFPIQDTIQCPSPQNQIQICIKESVLMP